MATSTTPKSKPTIVVQPGSGHTAYHFLQLNSKLQQYGYPVVCDQLASVNPPEPGVCDMSSDIIHIQRNLLQPLVDKGRDVVLVCHSIAGYAGGAAALAYSKKGRRAQGQAGGIVGVILIAAFMAYEDAKPIAKLPDGSWPSDYKVDEEKGLWTFANPSQLYSPDVPEDLAAEAIAALHPMSVKAVADITPALTANWSKSDYEGCMAYVRCTQDVVVPIALQDFMLQQSGANWTIITMDTSHSPFLSRPAELSETIASLATAFTK